MSRSGYDKLKYLREEIDDLVRYLAEKSANDKRFKDEAAKKPYYKDEKVRQYLALRHYMATGDYTHFITLNFNSPRNEPITIPAAGKKISKWHQETDEEVYGRNYHKMQSHERTSFIGFAENVDSNVHYHMFVNTPNVEAFDECAGRIWKKWVKGGQFFSHSKIFRVSDKINIAQYITKQLMRGDNYDNFIVSEIGGSAEKKAIVAPIWRQE